MTTTIIISIIVTFIFLFTTHPLSMGFALLAQTLLISIITGSMAQDFWYSYIIFIIIIGGMLVLFIYITSVASNENFNTSPTIIVISAITLLPIIFISLSENFWNFNIINNSEISNFEVNDQIILTINNYINFPSNIIIFFLIIYLLITLIAVVNITNINYGPLRQNF